MPKTQNTIGIVHNTITTCCRKNKGFMKGTIYILFCALHLIHFKNMNEFCYFFVVNFWTFFATELNTLSENEPINTTSCKDDYRLLLPLFNHILCYRHVKMSSPNLNNLILIGCILVYLSVIINGIDTNLVSIHTMSVMCQVLCTNAQKYNIRLFVVVM